MATLLVAFVALCVGCSQDSDTPNDPAQDKAFQDQLAAAAANHAQRPHGPKPDLAGIAKKLAESRKAGNQASGAPKDASKPADATSDKPKSDPASTPAPSK